ncbi:hypothetical protein RND81_06G036900 [Saponaria officinalis]|uniref:Protein kinase domain-containing protein n=1 Tax=Saponaria officinalis TaxID=3572 RepID=A0AAW1K3R3_SAPOF
MMRQFPKLTLLFLIISLFTYRSFGLNNDGVLLLSFKFSILNDPFHVLATWTVFDDTPCHWHGVSCGPTNEWWTNSGSDSDLGRVTGVSLPGSQLMGTIPANFGLLDRLQTLNLSSNSINGSIPDTLYSLSTLRVLDVSDNAMSGELSDSIVGLRSLQELHVSGNFYSGNIPRNLGSLPNLDVVSLRGNNFTGYFPLGFNRVRFFDLSSNLINGSLPVDFGEGNNNIEYFNISHNRITGEIPQEFGRSFSRNTTLDFSYNNFTGEIPDSSLFINQKNNSFAGNPDLCGLLLSGPCRADLSPSALPTALGQPIPPPAFAAIPKTFASSPVSPRQENRQNGKRHGLKPQTIAWIVVGDAGGIAILCMFLLYIYKRKTTNTSTNTNTTTKALNIRTPSLNSSPSSESKGITRWSCLRKGKNTDDDETDEDETESSVDEEPVYQEKGQLVTIDGESELELETLLKASAYILGASGSSIMYKAVLEDGTVLAVRRVGESGSVERLKEFESHVRGIAKMAHPNLVRVRGFYWAADEKLVIYEYVPGGSLANARYRKAGSSPCHIPWEVRLRIAKGVARGLSYIHEKKHVHGNLKPSNILLDMDMEPKIGDFGIDKLTTGKSGYIPGGSTRHFGSKRSTASRESFQDYSVGATPSPSASSIGCVSPYHPPESLRSLKPNPKWDVYSYGVILLELLTGKVIISDELGPPVLAGLAVGLDDKTRVLRMADPAIRVDLEGKEEDLFNCLKLGYNCVSHVPQKRPTIKEALHVLEKISSSSTTLSSSYRYGP